MSRSSDGASKCVLVGEGALPRLQNILWAEEFFVGQDAAADAAAPSAAGGPRQAREEGASALTYTMSLPGTWPTHGLSIGWRASSGGAGAAALNMSEAVESWQLRPVPINEGEVGVRRVVAAAAGADEEEVRATGIELWDVQLKEDKEWVFACKARDEAPPTMALYIVHGVGIFSEGNQKPVYTNEGHLLSFEDAEAAAEGASSMVTVRVRSHPCETLRFLLFAPSSSVLLSQPTR